jgi:hypothetical protein
MEKKNKSKRRSSPELMASAAWWLQAPSEMQFPLGNVPPEKKISSGIEGEVAALNDAASARARTTVKQDYWEGGSAEERSRE